MQIDLTAVAANVDCGDPAVWRITKSGLEDFETVVTVLGGTAISGGFTGSIGDALTAAAATDPHVTRITGNLQLRLAAGFVGPLDIARPTVERTGQGDKTTSLKIVSLSAGTIGNAEAFITLVDDGIVLAAPVFDQDPSISGDPLPGGILTRVAGVVTGSPDPIVTWVWQRGGVPIEGTEGAPTYLILQSDEGLIITVKDMAINSVDSAEAVSAGVTIQSDDTAPEASLIPAIVGLNPPQVGSALTCDDFTWVGNPPPQVTRVWQKNGVDIPNSSASLYTPVTGDIGGVLRRVERGNNGVGGTVEEATVATSAVVAAAGGALEDVALDNDTILWYGAENTHIANFLPQGGAIGSVSFVSGGDAGGKVKLNGTTGLRIGPSLVHFGVTGNPSASVSYNEVDMFYSATLEFTGANGGQFQKTFQLRPRYPMIAPTGGNVPGHTEIIVTSLGSLRTELETPTTDPRVIRCHPDMRIIQTGNNSYIARIDGKKNFTVIGHRRMCLRDSCITIKSAENFVFINFAMRVGADPGGLSRDNRDNFEVRHCLNGAFYHCEGSWSIDEQGSVIRFISGDSKYPNGLPLPARFLMYACAFYEPLRFSGHDHTENSHPYGVLKYTGSQQCWTIKCVFLHNNQRNPTAAGHTSTMTQNCLIAKYSSSGGLGGVGFSSANSSLENNIETSAIVQGNLFVPNNISSADDRDAAVKFSRVGTGGRIYVAPTADPYVNQFGRFDAAQGKHVFCTTPPFNPSQIALRNGSTLASLVSFKPFVVEGHDPMPTSNAAECDALYEHLVGVDDAIVGVREMVGDPLDLVPVPGHLAMSKIGRDVFQLFRNSGSVRTQTGGYITDPPVSFSDLGTYKPEEDTVKDLYDMSLPV